MAKVSYTTIDEYLDLCAEEYRERLQLIRGLVREEAPEAVEKISWGLPTAMYHGILIQYGACKGYVGFYPLPEAVDAFSGELAGYKTTKGAIHLPMDRELPVDLVRRMIRFKAEYNEKNSK